MSKYADKLKDPRWQKKRLYVFQRDKWACQDCGSKIKTLHVHHKKYKPKTDPWKYPKNTLITKCVDCHKKAHLSILEKIDLLLKSRLKNWEIIERHHRNNEPVWVLTVERYNELTIEIRKLMVELKNERQG